MNAEREKLTIPDLKAKKTAGERMVMVAVGEVLSAAWAERAGIDILGIGDSIGMTLYGHENTLAITVDQMIEHTRAVRRGAPNTFTIAAMPYGSYATKDIAVTNALQMMKESGVDALKLQGGREIFDIIRAVADAGIPVMSHVGLIPHHVHKHGGFKMQGRTANDALQSSTMPKPLKKLAPSDWKSKPFPMRSDKPSTTPSTSSRFPLARVPPEPARCSMATTLLVPSIPSNQSSPSAMAMSRT